MPLTPLQDLIRRVAALEGRRGPDHVIAEITEAGSEPSPAGVTGYYHRWTFSVQMLDQEFRRSGGVITNVAALQSHLTPDGTLTGETGSAVSHTHGPGTLETASVPLAVGDVVMLARARLGTGGFWVIMGKLDPGTLVEIVAHRDTFNA